MLLRTAFATGFLATAANAWNTDVHNQIGFAAETYLTSYTTSILQRILEPQYLGSIGRAAAWADSYDHTDEGAFSYQWHWIDSSDNPPAYCNVYYNRDCTAGGCVVSAIANQTSILRGCIARAKAGELTNGTNTDCSNALKWIAHFLGDITQPLHASGAAEGGNSYNVTFGGVETELHAVWDGKIIYSDANVTKFSNTSISPFFKGLVEKSILDEFPVPTAEWTACSDPSTPIECAMDWARDSNAWTCDYVYSQIYNGTDLVTSGYAKGAYPIVELQVSKAALRLGTWLNKLVMEEYNKDRQVVLGNVPSWVDGPSAGE